MKCTRSHLNVSLPAIVGLAMIALVAAGCLNAAPSGQERATTEPTTSPTSMPVVKVTGVEASYDLGTVPVSSEHFIVFEVDNPKDKAVAIKKTRSECDCISLVDAPASLAAKTATPIKVKFVAPKVAISYRTSLAIFTDDSDRKMITLRVECKTVAK